MLTIVLYEPIGEGDASAKAVLAAIAKVSPNTPVTVAIHSPGGSVFEGEAIYNALKRHKGRVVCRIDGLCASAASYIMCAADEILMAPGAHIMIHSPMAFGGGNQQEFRSLIEKLEILERQYCRVYSQRTGNDEARVREWMTAETWFTAEQALQSGFCDRIDDSIAMAAYIPGDFNRFGYRNVPVAVKALNNPDLAQAKAEEQKVVAAKPKMTAEQIAENKLSREALVRRAKRIAMRRYGNGGQAA